MRIKVFLEPEEMEGEKPFFQVDMDTDPGVKDAYFFQSNVRRLYAIYISLVENTINFGFEFDRDQFLEDLGSNRTSIDETLEHEPGAGLEDWLDKKMQKLVAQHDAEIAQAGIDMDAERNGEV